MTDQTNIPVDIDSQETQEWLNALRDVVEADGPERAAFLLAQLQGEAPALGLSSAYTGLNTPYANTIPTAVQPQYPGDLKLEAKLQDYMRYNTAAMVAGANSRDGSLGGHISTYCSSCTLYEVGFNHFFHAPTAEHGGDLIYYQGHAAPGMYVRSFLEGRISPEQVLNFRKETEGKGLSSYPHPWLMPNYWQFPTVSMGLGPITAIYQAYVMKYLEARGLADTHQRKVWAFCGDGEMDEPESTGALTRAGREKLDNLIFVVNCNLQRLDGLVNGDGKIVQELESTFRGCGWNVIKVMWAANWEPLFNKDHTGVLMKYLTQACDGDLQTYQARGGAYMREHFFGQDPALSKLVEDLSDDEIHALARGGHDAEKVYAAYDAAVNHAGSPTVVLVQTVKGYGLGAAGESKNIAHNVKKLSVAELEYVRDYYDVPATDKQVANYELIKPKKDSELDRYLHERRHTLGGYLPARHAPKVKLEIPHYQDFAKRLLAGTGDERTMSSTTAYVQILTALCRDKHIGKRCVPITPDESRTFGMEGLFRQLGIFSQTGQRYVPEDREQVMYYKEAKDGQILQVGINEAGGMSAWIAVATAYSMHDVPLIPFYIYYSMFGHQRIGDLAWLAGDARARGFLLGATAGRTTLNGEGLQHEDGHTQIMANLIPNVVSYDPTYAYELAVIMWSGLQRMYVNNEDISFYITMMNENYHHPAMPEGVEAGILKGLYKLKSSPTVDKQKHVQLMGSGSILIEVEAAAEMLAKDFGVTSDVWSMTSANELYRDGLSTARWNRLHPDQQPKKAYITQQLAQTTGPIIAATDYVRLFTEQLRDFIPRSLITLGTDGFGRSDSRSALRQHFEVDRYHIAYSAIKALFDQGIVDAVLVKKALKQYNIDPNKPEPITH